jgi:Zn-dependent protease with chaperone function
MERFRGWCYAADGPQRVAVEAAVDAAGALSIAGASAVPWSALQVSDRVGNIPRRITLPDGRVLETTENDAVDRIEARFRQGIGTAWAHRLERRWRWALLALVLAVAAGWAAVTYGVPFTARVVSFALPADVLAIASQQTLATFDRAVLRPSGLLPARQAEIAAMLRRVGEAAGDPERYRLAMRNGGPIGPNAFALPDGTIVVTDQLVQLAEHDEEILAVLAHEVGHVERRHGMQRVAQSTALGLLLTIVSGDVSQVAAVISALPAMLIEAGYSREFEREADARAVSLLNAMGVPPSRLARFLERMQEKIGKDSGPSWLASHPPTAERMQAIWDRTKR